MFGPRKPGEGPPDYENFVQENTPDTGKILQVCNGFNSYHCIPIEQMFGPRKPGQGPPDYENFAQRKYEDPTSGQVISICNGFNSHDCIEPDQLKDPQLRAKMVSEYDPTPKNHKGHHHAQTGETQATPETGKIIQICNGTNSHNCVEAEKVFGRQLPGNPNLSHLPICDNSNGELGKDCRQSGGYTNLQLELEDVNSVTLERSIDADGLVHYERNFY